MTDVIYPDSDRFTIQWIEIGDELMPIPGDNGNPKLEKKQQDERINHVCDTGACVQKEVIFNNPAPKEKCVLGEI